MKFEEKKDFFLCIFHQFFRVQRYKIKNFFPLLFTTLSLLIFLTNAKRFRRKLASFFGKLESVNFIRAYLQGV